MTRLPLALVALVLAFPGNAGAARTCPSKSDYEVNRVTNVSCAKAERVIREYFKNGSPALGYDCRAKQYPGGVTTICRKGDKKIKHLSYD